MYPVLCIQQWTQQTKSASLVEFTFHWRGLSWLGNRWDPGKSLSDSRVREIGKQHQSTNRPPGFIQHLHSWLCPHTADHITLTIILCPGWRGSKGSEWRVRDLVFRLRMFSNSFGPPTQRSTGMTRVERALTAPCNGIILQLWNVVANGSVEHLHF